MWDTFSFATFPEYRSITDEAATGIHMCWQIGYVGWSWLAVRRYRPTWSCCEINKDRIGRWFVSLSGTRYPCTLDHSYIPKLSKLVLWNDEETFFLLFDLDATSWDLLVVKIGRHNVFWYILQSFWYSENSKGRSVECAIISTESY